MVTDGTFGGPANNGSIEWYGNVTFTGSGTLSPCRMRPGSNIKNITATFDQDMTLTYVGGSGTGGLGLYTSNSGNDSITVTINAGRTVTCVDYCSFGTTSSTSTNSAIKSWFNINGTLMLSGTNNSTLSLRTVSPGATVLNVNGAVNASRNFYPTGTTGYTSTVTIGTGGTMTVGTGGTGGTCDFATPAQVVTGAGTFALASGATLNIGAPAGLDAASGQIQTGTRSFSQSGRYSYVGTAAQVTGPDLPGAVSRLTINNAAGVTLSAGVTTDTLSMTNGVLRTGSTYFNAIGVNGAIIGGGPGAFIDGLLYTPIGQGISQSFHLGTDTTYLPITLRPGTEGGSGQFGMSVFDEGVVPLSAPTGVTHLKHYYSLVHSGTLTSTFDTVVVRYSAADVQAAGIAPTWLGAALLQGGAWVPLTVSKLDTVARTLTLTGVPSIGDILIGQFVPVADFRSRAVAFDSVLVLSTKKDSVVVLNPGIDTLKINVGVISDTAVTVTPSSAVVLAGDSVKFYFTYAPKNASALAGTVQFVSNTPLGYDTVSVTGKGKLYTIAEVKSLPAGTVVAFSGVVTRTLGRNTWLQQDTLGYMVYQSSGSLRDSVNAGAVKKGDVLIVNGTISVYNQLQEITPVRAWKKIGTDVVPQPAEVTLAQIAANGTVYQSRLITVKKARLVGTTDLVFAASKTYSVVDSSDTSKAVALRIGYATDTYIDGLPVPTELFNFTGPLGQYSSSPTTGFQLTPVDSADIEALYGSSVFSQKTVVFDSLLAGLTRTDSIVVLSSGVLPLAISVSSISDTTFKVTPLSATVPIGDSVKFYITFAPLGPENFTADIVFSLNAQQKRDTVQVSGKGFAYTLAQVRRMQVPSPVAFGALVTRTRGSYTYMQDDSAGIMLYHPSGSFKDSVASGFVKKGSFLGINGVTSLYYNLLEIQGADLKVWVPIGSGTLPDPIPLTLADIAAEGENHEARLIKVVNLEVRGTTDTVWSQGASYKNYSVIDPSDTSKVVLLRIGRVADTYVNGLRIPTEPFTFTGVLSQYSSTAGTGYQLMPIDTSDIKAGFVVGVEEPVAQTVPTVYSLEQNYPNPFNPSTRVEFSIPKQSNVELKVYNMLGQEVATLLSGPMGAGRHTVTFDARNLASGLYFYRIVAGEFTSVRKMMLVK